MRFLVFQLQGALSSWGDIAIGEFRGSHEYPGESALLGLLSAALGLRREDDEALARLREGYGFAVGVQSGGQLLRDYHTVQVPRQVALKGRPHATRKDELDVPKAELHTILSTRDYRQDSSSLVAVQPRDMPPYTLEALAEALHCPRFVLYLGRKSCPPTAPLFPKVVEADSAYATFDAYIEIVKALNEAQSDAHGRALLEPPSCVRKIAWGSGIEAGVSADLSTSRKDRVIRRREWRFGDRIEHVALLAEGE